MRVSAYFVMQICNVLLFVGVDNFFLLVELEMSKSDAANEESHVLNPEDDYWVCSF